MSRLGMTGADAGDTLCTIHLEVTCWHGIDKFDSWPDSEPIDSMVHPV